MMETVCIEGRTCDGGENTSFCDQYFMADFTSRGGKLHMIDGRVERGVDILEKRSSTGYI